MTKLLVSLFWIAIWHRIRIRIECAIHILHVVQVRYKRVSRLFNCIYHIFHEKKVYFHHVVFIPIYLPSKVVSRTNLLMSGVGSGQKVERISAVSHAQTFIQHFSRNRALCN